MSYAEVVGRTMMDRTGFSADQGSVFDTSLDTSGSMEVKGPALKY